MIDGEIPYRGGKFYRYTLRVIDRESIIVMGGDSRGSKPNEGTASC